MKAKDHCDAALERAKHLLRLYELLHDTRKRDARSDWIQSFNKLMHWPTAEQIVRVDGKDRHSLLILRQSVGIEREYFAHEYVSELLRAAIVAAVSAIDRYFHDVVVEHSWAVLSRNEEEVPKELQKIMIPVLDAKRALTKLRSDSKSRPSSLVKKVIQEVLHKEYTFQNPDDIVRAAQMLGITDFWTKVAAEMPTTPSKDQLIAELKALARRRNQIVHEADLVRKTKAKKITLRDIGENDARRWIELVEQLVTAVDSVVTTTA